MTWHRKTQLHYITLHYITLHCITLHYITLHYITLHYITLHYITLHYITLHYITQISSPTTMQLNMYVNIFLCLHLLFLTTFFPHLYVRTCAAAKRDDRVGQLSLLFG